MANRDRPSSSGCIGFFANTLPLRLRLGGNSTLRALLGRVRSRCSTPRTPGGAVRGRRRRPCDRRVTPRRTRSSRSTSASASMPRRRLELAATRRAACLSTSASRGSSWRSSCTYMTAGVLAPVQLRLRICSTPQRSIGWPNDFIAALRQAVTAPGDEATRASGLAGEWTSAGRVAEGAGIQSFRSSGSSAGSLGLRTLCPPWASSPTTFGPS